MKQYPGYTLVKREDCPEQHGTLTVLTHDVSGAAVLLVENDDDNKHRHRLLFLSGLHAKNNHFHEGIFISL